MSSDDRNAFARTISSIKSTIPFQVITVLSSGFALYRSFHEINIPFVVWLLVGAAVGAIVFNIGRTAYTRATAEELPASGTDFSPFRGTPGWTPLRREKVKAEISDLIETTASRHLLLVSPSGAGKSTMLRDLILPEMEKSAGYKVRRFENYTDITSILLGALRKLHGDGAGMDELGELRETIESANPPHGDLLAKIETVLSAMTPKQPILLCFDQLERYSLDLDTSSDRNAKQHEIFQAVVKSLARNAHVRTVFLVRNEFLFGSLSSVFGISSNGSDVDANVKFYFLWGINEEDDKADCAKLADDFDETHGVALRVKLFGVGQVGNRAKANSFLLNLAGYLFDKFRERKKYFRRLLQPNLSADEVIDVYLDAAFEGYIARSGVSDRALFDTVLYALANENKVSGQACSTRRLAGLAHYPEDDVGRVIRYLDDIKVVSSANVEVETEGLTTPTSVYRISHEKISDRLLKSDKINLDSRAIDGIRYLTENRVGSDKLTVPSSFPTSLDLAAVWPPNPSYLAVVTFTIFGLARCLAPQYIYDHVNDWTGLYTWVNRTFYPFHSYYMEPVMYVPHFLAHVAWVSYIDRVNRSFLRFTSGWVLWFFSYCLAPIGIAFGVAVAYCPELFPIPIVFIGILYGIILISLSLTKQLGGQMRQITLHWGIRSIINVLVVFALGWWVIAPLFTLADPNDAAEVSRILLLIVFESVLILWFWWHIRPDQNVSRIWAANLALFDKGRIFGR